MLYLPEFDVYTDPTASYSSFGTLPEGSYDKPVLHISNAGGRLARTPPMKPEDHVSIARTTISIAGDGTVKGTTRQTGTGIFAESARFQWQLRCRSRAARSLLRMYSATLTNPGRGVFEPAAPFDLAEPYMVQGEFSLYQKLPIPLSGSHRIPFGIPINLRPGLALIGPRIEHRKTDFNCFAGKQVDGDRTDIRSGSTAAASHPGYHHRQQIFHVPIALHDQRPNPDRPSPSSSRTWRVKYVPRKLRPS